MAKRLAAGQSTLGSWVKFGSMLVSGVLITCLTCLTLLLLLCFYFTAAEASIPEEIVPLDSQPDLNFAQSDYESLI